jgi:hypothetical protein
LRRRSSTVVSSCQRAASSDHDDENSKMTSPVAARSSVGVSIQCDMRTSVE